MRTGFLGVFSYNKIKKEPQGNTIRKSPDPQNQLGAYMDMAMTGHEFYKSSKDAERGLQGGFLELGSSSKFPGLGF